VRIEAEIVGSLADPDFGPVNDVIWAVQSALLAPAMPTGHAMPRPAPQVASSGTGTARPSPDAPTRDPSDPNGVERTIRTIDRFRREVGEVLDEYGQTGRERRNDP